MLILIFLGILDTLYLTYEHFANIVPPCPAHSLLGSFVDCGKVLASAPLLAPIGLIYYLFLLIIYKFRPEFLKLIIPFGLIVSIFLLFVQIFVLHALCLYCLFSGILNLLLFVLVFAKIGRSS